MSKNTPEWPPAEGKMMLMKTFIVVTVRVIPRIFVRYI